MTISNNADVFCGCKVQDYAEADDWAGPATAYRLRIGWDDEPNALQERLTELAAHNEARKLQALVIGSWSGDDSSMGSDKVIEMLVANKDAFPALRGLFLGDITSEENEISWIQQSDVSPLLKAFPQLEVLRVRGGNGLSFSKTNHAALRELIVEAGGLPRSVIREICLCTFLNVEHLELWLGVQEYGWDGGVEDLQPLLSGKLFPKLRNLGLRNSEIADDIAPVVVNAPILQRLEVLDLSNGTLSDIGAQALLNLSKDLPLKELNLSHHYMTEPVVKQLQKALKCKVIADDAQDPNEEWRSVVVSE